MAQRHHSLDLSEIADVTDMVVGFEEHNNCTLVLLVSTEVTTRSRTLIIEGQAWSADKALPEASILASVSVRCSTMNLKAWNSALIHVLYALDFNLAVNELGHAKLKDA